MTRIGYSQLIDSSIGLMRGNQEELFRLQKQLATGKKFTDMSDDPASMLASRRLKARIRQDEQIIRSLQENHRYIAESETHMTSTIEQLQRIRTLSLQASNGTMATADMAHVATEINEQLEAMVRTGNSRTAGRGIFGGAETADDAFTVTRNAQGEITGVVYAGDQVELKVSAGTTIPVSWPGSRVFASGPQVRVSTSALWNGANASSYADREIAARMIPSSGAMSGSLRINGRQVDYDLDGAVSGGEGDSLLDLADKINEVSPGVTARVTGVIEGTGGIGLAGAAPATFATLAGFTAGTFTLNGQSISVAGTDTIFTLADRINSFESATNVTAEVFDANGNRIDGTPSVATATVPFRLRLSGGAEISDDAAGSTNVLQNGGFLGITANPALPTGQNLVATRIQNYALQITSDQPGPFTIEDASGSLAADLGLTTAASVTSGGLIFDTLIRLRDEMRAGDQATVRNSLLGEIDGALSMVEVSRSEAGVRTRSLEEQQRRTESVLFNERELLSDTEDVDLAEVISNLRLQETTQNAALRATADILRLSLLNFLS